MKGSDQSFFFFFSISLRFKEETHFHDSVLQKGVIFGSSFSFCEWLLAAFGLQQWTHELHLDVWVKFPTNTLECVAVIYTFQIAIVLLKETEQEETWNCKSTFTPFWLQTCWPFKRIGLLSLSVILVPLFIMKQGNFSEDYLNSDFQRE